MLTDNDRLLTLPTAYHRIDGELYSQSDCSICERERWLVYTKYHDIGCENTTSPYAYSVSVRVHWFTSYLRLRIISTSFFT